jgi:hypothetical protein
MTRAVHERGGDVDQECNALPAFTVEKKKFGTRTMKGPVKGVAIDRACGGLG